MTEGDVVQGSSFEALFLSGGEVSPALRQQLRGVGVDLSRLEPLYPAATWGKAVQLARAEIYPGQTEAEGWRLLGQRFLKGFLSTLIGKVAGAAMHLLTPQRLLERAPKHMKLGGNTSRLELDASSEKSVTFRYTDALVPGEFMVGCLEAVLLNRGISPRSAVTTVGANQYRLVLSWE